MKSNPAYSNILDTVETSDIRIDFLDQSQLFGSSGNACCFSNNMDFTVPWFSPIPICCNGEVSEMPLNPYEDMLEKRWERFADDIVDAKKASTPLCFFPVYILHVSTLFMGDVLACGLCSQHLYYIPQAKRLNHIYQILKQHNRSTFAPMFIDARLRRRFYRGYEFVSHWRYHVTLTRYSSPEAFSNRIPPEAAPTILNLPLSHPAGLEPIHVEDYYPTSVADESCVPWLCCFVPAIDHGLEVSVPVSQLHEN